MLFFELFLFCIGNVVSFHCVHDSTIQEMKPKKMEIHQKNDKSLNFMTSNTQSNHPLKFYIDYQGLEAYVTVSDEYKTKINEAFLSTTKAFSGLLSVEGTDTVLTFDEIDYCNSHLELTEDYKTGINADIVIFPIVRTGKDLGSGVIASAKSCYLHSGTNRTIAGTVYIKSDNDFTKKNSDKYLQTILLHELTHVLGFSSSLFEYFQSSSQPITKRATINGYTRTLITSPKVVKVAREYYGCDTLEGVELENQGSSGSVGSHWEARIMMGDIMTSTDNYEYSISEITLALLEDSGWYKVNYYTGGLFKFGKKEGCTFLNSTCIQNEKTNFPKEYCLNSDASICYTGGMIKGYCVLGKYSSSIPQGFQYFGDPTRGGLKNADYCPMASVASDSEYLMPTFCKYGKPTDERTALGEEIGDNSICIDTTLSTNEDTTNKGASKAICYKISCDDTNQSIIITIGQKTVSCKEGTESVTVEGYEGNIKCPQYSNFCHITTWCNDPFECIEKKSIFNDLKDVTDKSYTQSDLKTTAYTQSDLNTTVIDINTSSLIKVSTILLYLDILLL